MSPDVPAIDANPDRRRDRVAAVLLAAPAALFVPLILHHPVLRLGHDAAPATVAAGLATMAGTNALFHGVVLAMLGVQALGLYAFAERLGLARTTVRAGVVAGALAGVLLTLAGVADGFVTPLLQRRCDGGASCGDALLAALSFESAAIQALTTVGLAAYAIALVAWSIAWLVARPTIVGVVALVVAALPLALLAQGGFIGPTRLAALLGPISLWSLVAAASLWTGSRFVGARPVPDPR